MPLGRDLGGGKQARLSMGAVLCPRLGIASFSATSRPLPRPRHPSFGEGLISETKVVSLPMIRKTRKAQIAVPKAIRARHLPHSSVALLPVRSVVDWVYHLLRRGLLERKVERLHQWAHSAASP
jgi:hypothetical protein